MSLATNETTPFGRGRRRRSKSRRNDEGMRRTGIGDWELEPHDRHRQRFGASTTS